GDSRELDQAHHGAHHGRGGHARGHHVSPGGAAWPDPAPSPSRGAGPGMRSGLCAGGRPRPAPAPVVEHVAGLRRMQRGLDPGVGLTTALATGRSGTGVLAPPIRAVGVVFRWGKGLGAIPIDARAAAGGREVVPLGRPAVEGERFRRATRECLWALAAIELMLEDSAVDRATLAGERTARLFVSAAGDGGANRALMRGSGGGTHFAYSAPAVVSAEAAIEFGLHGPAALFIGGPPATLRAIWYAATLLGSGTCDRALVLAGETFAEGAG